MKANKKLILLLLAGFVVRLLLLPLAHHGDLNNNISWGETALERGLVGYYEGSTWQFSAPNQPPLYILLFTATSLVFGSVKSLFWSLNAFSVFPSSLVWFWQNWGADLTAKLPGILADVGIAYLIYIYFREKKKVKTALLLSLIWLANPVAVYSSAIWGQTDSVVNFLGLVSIYFLLKKRLVYSIIFLTTSILFKGSLFIFIPLILIVALKQKHKLTLWAKAAVASFAVVIVSSVWFHPQIDLPIWLTNLYLNRFFPGEIGDLTANAFNLWWLIDPGKTLDSIVYFGIPARVLGMGISLGLILVIIYKVSKQLTAKKVWFALSLCALVAFLFMTRIHERYLYPFFPSATILIGFLPWLAPAYIILSLLHLLNLYHLFWAPSIPVLEVWYKNNSIQIGNAVSVLTILIFVSLLVLFLKAKDQSKQELV